MADKLEEFKAYDATVIALTPELPEFSNDTADRNEVPFPILTDLNHQVAEKYGLVFDLGILAGLYEGFAEVSKKNGAAAGGKLPITATYIIDPSGKITYAFVNPDYKQRAEPADILKALEKTPRK